MIQARATDPETSKAAARDLEASGEGAEQRRSVLAALRRAREPVTARELAQRAGLDRYTVSRRLPELRSDGDVQNDFPRRCRVGGRQSMTWTPNRED